jgi:hypothetical protein
LCPENVGNLERALHAGAVWTGVMDPTEIGIVWTAAGVVVGFSVNAFIFRIGREAKKRELGDDYWLPPADFVLIEVVNWM